MELGDFGQWAGFVIAIIAAVIAWKKAPSERKVLDAQAEDFVTQAASRLIQDLRAEIERARKYSQRIKEERHNEVENLKAQHDREIALLRNENADLRDENERLESRVVRLEARILRLEGDRT